MVIGCRSGPAGQPLSRVWSFGYVLGWIGGFPWLDRPDLLETKRTSRVGRSHFLEAKTGHCSITFLFSSAFKVGLGTDVSCMYIQLQVSEMNHTCTCKRCDSAMKDTQVRVYRSMTWMTTNKAKACAKKGNHNVRCDSFKAEIWPA